MKIHTIKKGETLWQIAQSHKLTLDELMDANPQITNPNQIYIGDKVFIPEKETRPQPPKCPPGCRPIRPQPRAEEATADYTDFELDSDYAAMPVSSKYYSYERPTTPKEETHYTDKYRSKYEMDYVSPEGDRYHCHCHEYDDDDMDNWKPTQSKPYVHTVKKGDTLYKIARTNGFTVDQLLKVNPQLTEDKIIYPGDKVFIPSRDMLAQIPMPLEGAGSKELIDYLEGEDYYLVCPYCGHKMRR